MYLKYNNTIYVHGYVSELIFSSLSEEYGS